MNSVRSIEFHPGTREERLPGFSPAFPYIASRAELDAYPDRIVPWHWHKSLELSYVESGEVEYRTPGGTILFSAGSGALVNSNVLHSTRAVARDVPNVHLVHLFDPSFLSGMPGSRIEMSYLSPILTAPQLEILPLLPQEPAHAEVLALLRRSWSLSPGEFGYELKLRSLLSELWLLLLQAARPILAAPAPHRRDSTKLKEMMAYIHEHYTEQITVRSLASAAFLSERECYRTFQDYLHTTPAEYLKSYRLQMACRMLAEGREPVTGIGQSCGLGSGSYFGHIFRERMGCTPSQYRQKWQDRDNSRQE